MNISACSEDLICIARITKGTNTAHDASIGHLDFLFCEVPVKYFAKFSTELFLFLIAL